MKVSSLIKQLNTCDPNSEVIVQKDGEGNGFSPLSCVSKNAIYIPESTWSGEVFSLGWSAEDCCLEEDEWKQMKITHKPVIILVPIN